MKLPLHLFSPITKGIGSALLFLGYFLIVHGVVDQLGQADSRSITEITMSLVSDTHE